jgi:hypothetical protein
MNGYLRISITELSRNFASILRTSNSTMSVLCGSANPNTDVVAQLPSEQFEHPDSPNCAIVIGIARAAMSRPFLFGKRNQSGLAPFSSGERMSRIARTLASKLFQVSAVATEWESLRQF